VAEAAEIELLAGRIRDGVVGRSESLGRLLDYLAQTSAAGRRPKEYEVAQAVFGRGDGFDGAQDATVRVAAHRLRRKLQDFYAGPGRQEPVRLVLPSGEYRLALAPSPLPGRLGLAGRNALWAALGLILLLNLAVWAFFWASHRPDPALAAARAAAPWAELLNSEAPTLLVVGDYYIFGETDPQSGVDRLVREYTINARGDLDALMRADPAARDRYRDMGLTYLPVGTAFALRSLVPVLTVGDRSPRMALASDLTAEMLRDYNVVYVGYLSGLGLLKEPVFAGSRFAVGETYDELVDSRTGRRFVSEEGDPLRPDASHRDYGYFASFRGPEGRRIVVVAGARDSSLMQAAEAASTPAALKALAPASGGEFEALYEVEALRRRNVAGRLLSVTPRLEKRDWTTLQFPRG
jgi:hypothetical protein